MILPCQMYIRNTCAGKAADWHASSITLWQPGALTPFCSSPLRHVVKGVHGGGTTHMLGRRL